MAKRRWTDEEVAFLRAESRRLPSSDIAQQLGRSWRSVSCKAQELGVVFQAKRMTDGSLSTRWTKADEFLLEGCTEHMSLEQAARKLGRTRDAVSNKARKMGLSFLDGQRTIKDTAALLGVSVGTVIRRRKKLKRKFRVNKKGTVSAKDIVALARDLLENPPKGRPHLRATSKSLHEVILHYDGLEG
jgi:hypothetical protein